MAQSVACGAAEVQSPSARPLGFLDLDKDIRLQVYDILEGRTKPYRYHTTCREDDDVCWQCRIWNEFEVAKKNLRLTCWTSAEEWTPAFFRSTTICLNSRRTPPMFKDMFLNDQADDALRPSGRAVKLSDSVKDWTDPTHCTQKLFRLRESAIKNLRNIEFAWSRKDTFPSVSATDDTRRTGYRLDAERLHEFGAIVRHHTPKLRLEKLSILYWPCDRYLWTPRPYDILGVNVTRLQLISEKLYVELFERKWAPTQRKGGSSSHCFDDCAIKIYYRWKKPTLIADCSDTVDPYSLPVEEDADGYSSGDSFSLSDSDDSSDGDAELSDSNEEDMSA
ncbi:hypothetical protein EDD37DRAFT_620846 [Exophiala viscosa]|uniref:uncharacterized protein n=1 Tax=Exophiala viscosa TaxID=2486360 RepID=UPI00219A2F0F|nr:hypothetical protein EDD37DRAFT_620846 [Exophiala viscosa]